MAYTPVPGAENAQADGGKVMLLTRLDSGVFGNGNGWIHAAIHWALDLAHGWDMDVRIICYASPSRATGNFYSGFFLI